MSHETFLKGKAILCCGDAMHFLKDQPDNRYDSIVTDPPYALVSITKRFGANGAAPVKVPEGGSGAYARASAGFMGKQWDTGETAFSVEFWTEVFRVLKPGGFVAAFGASRGYHRMACAIEDAGFEIRDSLMWIYGTGFPKSRNISKDIDNAEGAEREIIGTRKAPGMAKTNVEQGAQGRSVYEFAEYSKEAITDAAKEWEGWGTALKPAFEPIVLARKPLSEPTIAQNVLRWGTGALNIAACRVAGADVESPRHRHGGGVKGAGTSYEMPDSKGDIPPGRWPANVVTDGSDEVVAMFPESNSSGGSASLGAFRDGDIYGNGRNVVEKRDPGLGDSGSAARFFYSAKADSDDRLGSKHPTVKPVDLMQWLIRLVTPKGGFVLDPFAGTGTTAEACYREGMRCAMVERETDYQADIRRRMALVLAGPDERSRESIKAKLAGKPIDLGPLFGTMIALDAP